MGKTTILWNGDDFLNQFKAEANKRIARAAIHLSREIKQNISVAVVKGKSGGANTSYSKSAKRFRHNQTGQFVKARRFIVRSKPGEFPRKVFGELRRSVTYTVNKNNATARVGTNKIYGKYLELGTGIMQARPYLLPTLRANRRKIAALIAGKKIVIRSK